MAVVNGYFGSTSNIQARAFGYSIIDGPSSVSAKQINFFSELLNWKLWTSHLFNKGARNLGSTSLNALVKR